MNKIIPKNKILCEPQMGKRGLYPLFQLKKKNMTKNYMNFLSTLTVIIQLKKLQIK